MPRPVEEVFPPDKYDYIPNVAVFKTHRKVKSGRNVVVTKEDLEETAQVHNRLFDNYGRFSPFSKGHTLDVGPNGSEVPEVAQPDTCGGGFGLHVEKSPDPAEDEHILYCTWAIPKEEKEEVLKSFVSISAEYYPGKHWIFPFSLLKSSAPEIPDMPIIPLRYGADEDHFSLTLPLRYSHESPMANCDKDMKKDEPKKYEKDETPKKDDKDTKPKDDNPEMVKAEAGATKGSAEDGSKLDQIMAMVEQMAQYIPLLQQLQTMMEDEGEGDDPMAPADKGDDPKKGPMPPEKDSARNFDNPVRFDAGMGSGTNGFTPSFTKDQYMNSDDLVKYKAKTDSEIAALKQKLEAATKVGADLYKKNRVAEAEKIVYRLETESHIDFVNDAVRSEEVALIAELDEKNVAKWVDRIKVRYQKKLPNSAAVKDVTKYAAEPEVETPAKTPMEAYEAAMKVIRERAEAAAKKPL